MRSIQILAVVLWAFLSFGTLGHAQFVGKKKDVKVDFELEEYKTKHYVIDFEVGIKADTVQRVGKELEDILEQYVKIFRVEPKAPLHVMFMDSQNTFEQVGGAPSMAGFYNHTEMTVESSGQTKKGRYLFLKQMPYYDLIPTLYHEAFHQYIHQYLNFNDSMPIWFNEGMAGYFEEIQRDPGGGKNRNLNPERIDKSKLRGVRSAVETGTHIPLDKLIRADYDEFHDKSDKTKEQRYYDQSFAFVCFLMDTSKGKIPAAFVDALREGDDADQAHETIFGKDNEKLGRVEAAWKSYLRKSGPSNERSAATVAGGWRKVLESNMSSEYSQTRHEALKQVDVSTAENLQVLWGVLDRKSDPLVFDWFVRQGAVEALSNLETEEAKEEVLRLLNEKGHPHSKEAVIYSVIHSIRAGFVKDYGGADDEAVEEAKKKIRKTRGLEYIDMMLPRLEKLDPDRTGYEWMKIAFKDADSRVRLAALNGFLVYPQAETIPLVLEHMVELKALTEKSTKNRLLYYREWVMNRFVLEQLSGHFYGDVVEDWQDWWTLAKDQFSLEKRIEEELGGDDKDGSPKTIVVRRGGIEVAVNMKIAGKKDGYPMLVLPMRNYEPDYFRPYFHGLEEFLRVYYLYMPRIEDFKGLERRAESGYVDYPTEKLADVLYEYMKETGLERFAVMGHGPESCTLGMYVTASHPKEISHLILVNPRSAGSKYRNALENVKRVGRARRNKEVVHGVDHTFVQQDGTPNYEPADAAELEGLERALFNLCFADPTAPEVGTLDYLYELTSSVKVMADSEWSMQRIFGRKGPPRLPVLVCMGEQDPWTPVADMTGVAKYLRAARASFKKSAEFPFMSETYAFTKHVENFFTKTLPKKPKKKR